MTVRAAYGRVYRNQKEIQVDWDAGRDFMIADIFHGGGTCVNKDDAPKGEYVNVRYDNDQRVYVIRRAR